MYNATIKLIKMYIFNKHKIPSLTQIKKELANEKNNIRNLSILQNIKNKNICINSHTLDYAINDALNMYNGNMTKLKNKIIKHFRLRYLKLNKPNKILKIENLATKKFTFFKNALGDKVKCSVDNFNYSDNIKTVAIITKRKNEYYMLIKYKQKTEKILNNNLISIDPGIRTVITGYSTNGIVEIGTNVSKNLKMRLTKIDNVQSKFRKNKTENNTVINKKGLKIINKKYEKIKNRINDMHWKIIKHITLNKNILFGNFSTKKMGENKGTQKMTKRIGNCISFFKLKQKLTYMCNKKDINYKEVDERFTTQCCGKCGNQKKDIGSDKIYKCVKCKSEIKRDINSARLILITET
jgi:IS605 OrfB family transposase